MVSENFACHAGNETSTLLPFIVELLETHKDKLSQVSDDFKLATELLHESGKALLEFDQKLRKHTRKLQESDVEELMGSYLRFASLCERAGGNLVQKHHLMCHCIQKSVYLGNPRYYTTYRSESFNGVVARMARSVHSMLFYERFMAKSINQALSWANQVSILYG
jgi:exonuclease VII small subunit